MPEKELHNEKELLKRIATGDEQAFREIYDHYRNKVLTIANKVLQTEPEVLDALQEVFIKLWINRKKLADIDNFNAYLNTVTRNHLFNMLRKYAYEASAIAELAAADSIQQGEEEIDIRALKQTLYKAIGQLSPQQKKAFELSRLQGLKQEEIAAAMSISRETVKRHLAEAVRNLRIILGPENKALAIVIVLGFMA